MISWGAAELNNFVEQPCERHDSAAGGMLALHTRLGLNTADRFAWLSEAGPYCGRLNSEPNADKHRWDAVEASSEVADAVELSFLEDCASVRTPHDASSPAAPPLSMVRQSSPASCVQRSLIKRLHVCVSTNYLYFVVQAVTEFHILLLFPARLLVLNAVSRALVQDIALAGRGAPGYAGQPLSLIADSATSALYLATSETPPLQLLAILTRRSAEWLLCSFKH